MLYRPPGMTSMPSLPPLPDAVTKMYERVCNALFTQKYLIDYLHIADARERAAEHTPARTDGLFMDSRGRPVEIYAKAVGQRSCLIQDDDTTGDIVEQRTCNWERIAGGTSTMKTMRF
jgi:hypothetical protein